MSNDYALFIIIIPNDFELGTLIVPTTTSTNINRQASSRLSVNATSALVATASIPLSVSHSVAPLLSGRKSAPELFSTYQQSSPLSICILLKNYLAERNDIDPVWIMTNDKKSFQITFYIEFGLVSDRILHDLVKLSIGKSSGTKVCVLPTAIVLHGQQNKKDLSSTTSSSIDSLETSDNIIDNKLSSVNDATNLRQTNSSSLNDQTTLNKKRKHVGKSEFKKSVRARLMVHQVVASIRASSAITFDFILLICLASMLAALGLLENSTVILVASMLVSPLMNPILGIVFGLSVRDHSLWRRGLRNEIIGLLICMTCGFLLGLCTTVFETKWGSSSSFPTSEMKARGDVKRLWVGILIALPSGAGVALSVLGGNTGSLVGVAISASLLPPAVNCGLLFAYGLLGKISSRISVLEPFLFNNDSYLNCSKYLDNDYLPLYTCNLSSESVILGCCSLLLTIVNIVCIIIMALIILRIKEVVPLHQPNRDITNFFHYDVKVVRDYNKTIDENDFDPTNSTITTLNRRNHLAKTIINRWKSFKTPTYQQQSTEISSISKNIDNLESNNHINKLIPLNMESRRKLFRLKTFAKEYDLDILNEDDYNLTNNISREKVLLLISDLIDMCQEIPTIFIDLYHLQPLGSHSSSTDKEHMLFYQEIIELLPPKWYQLFKYERQRRRIPWTLDRSYSMRVPSLPSYQYSLTEPNDLKRHESLKKREKNFSRQNSAPQSKRSSETTIEKEIEVPIKGTRFRLLKSPTTTDIFSNESNLI